MTNRKKSIILVKCDLKSNVIEVLLDELNYFENIKKSTSLSNLISGESKELFRQMLNKIQNDKIEETKSLVFESSGRKELISLSGYLLNDIILFSGRIVPSEISENRILTEDSSLNSEDLPNPSSNEEKAGNNLNEDLFPNDLILDEFTKLNSILANNQRDLFKKNLEIENLNKALKDEKDSLELFAYSISHDLKEPIRMVKSFMSLFQKKYGHKLDDKGAKYVGYAVEGAMRMESMIHDLLYYYKATNIVNKEDVDLNRILSVVKNNLAEALRKSNAEILSDELPVVKGSAIAFHQVFQNLVSNAVKYVPENNEPLIKVNVKDIGKFWEFEINDNGIGIPEDKLSDIFNLFHRSESEDLFESSGIGLAIVKKIIEKSNGTIWVKSEVGIGSSFFFTVPKS